MYKVSIVDDESAACDAIEKQLLEYGSEHDVEFSAERYLGAEAYMAAHDEDSDIIFLDIDMPGINGMDLAREIRKTRPNVILIFCTNLEQFALNGYEVEACGYIIKPIRKYSFDFYMDKSLKWLWRKRKTDGDGEFKIYVKAVDGRRKVCVRDICYVEVGRHKLFYHVYKNGAPAEVIQARGSMQETEAQLAPFGFVRSSISYLVNLAYITEIRGNEVYLPEMVLFMSRNYKKPFIEAFMRSVSEDGVAVK